MNRYDITHLIWKLFAPYNCEIELSDLSRIYPTTNYTTIISFYNKDDKKIAIERFSQFLESHGWTPVKEDSFHIGKGFLKREGKKECYCMINFCGNTRRIEITPFFYRK